jgi:hypothetical protein
MQYLYDSVFAAETEASVCFDEMQVLNNDK